MMEVESSQETDFLICFYTGLGRVYKVVCPHSEERRFLKRVCAVSVGAWSISQGGGGRLCVAIVCRERSHGVR